MSRKTIPPPSTIRTMRRKYIASYFKRRGYTIADSPESGDIMVYQPNGFARLFQSHRAAYDFYFQHHARKQPKRYTSTKSGHSFLLPDGLTDDQRIETCRQMAQDARRMLMESKRMPSTLYLESYRFCTMTQHIRRIAHQHNIEAEIREIAFWAFGAE